MSDRTVTTGRTGSSNFPTKTIALSIGAALLVSTWLVPVILGWNAFQDPEATYTDSPYQASDPWSGLSGSDRDTIGTTIQSVGIITIVLSLVAMIFTGFAVWSGRRAAALSAIAITVVMLAIFFALRANGHLDAGWNGPLVIAAAIGGLAAAAIGLFTPTRSPSERRTLGRRPST